MAEFAVFLYHPTPDSDGAPGEREEHDQHGSALAESGSMVFGRALASPTASVTLRGDGVTEGPYADAGESVVGFYVLTADDLDGALEIARQNPILHQGGGLEVRPIA